MCTGAEETPTLNIRSAPAMGIAQSPDFSWRDRLHTPGADVAPEHGFVPTGRRDRPDEKYVHIRRSGRGSHGWPGRSWRRRLSVQPSPGQEAPSAARKAAGRHFLTVTGTKTERGVWRPASGPERGRCWERREGGCTPHGGISAPALLCPGRLLSGDQNTHQLAQEQVLASELLQALRFTKQQPPCPPAVKLRRTLEPPPLPSPNLSPGQSEHLRFSSNLAKTHQRRRSAPALPPQRDPVPPP